MPMAVPVMPPQQPIYTQTNHLLHLVLTLFTCGFWAFVWLGVYLGNENSNSRKDKQYRDDMGAYQRYQAELAEYQHKMWLYQKNNP